MKKKVWITKGSLVGVRWTKLDQMHSPIQSNDGAPPNMDTSFKV